MVAYMVNVVSRSNRILQIRQEEQRLLERV